MTQNKTNATMPKQLSPFTLMRQKMMGAVLATLLFASASAYADGTVKVDPRDALVIQASEANQKGNTQKLQEILPRVKGHPMEPWVHYWSVRTRLEQASADEVKAVFQRWPGSYVEDRLRNDWLLVLGSRQEWGTFAEQYAHFKMRDDSQVLCYALLIDHKNTYDATAQAREEFLKIRTAGVVEKGCNALASALYAEKKIPASDVWIKARRLAELNRSAATQRTVAIIASGMDSTISSLISNPEKWLKAQQASTSASKIAANATQSELITLALVRLAAKDPESAVSSMRNSWKAALSAEQQAWVYAVAGRITAIRLDPKALDYYKLSANAKGLNDEVIEWHARAQLRAAASSKNNHQGWQQLISVIDGMPGNLKKDTTWVFWKAVALRRGNAGADDTHPLRQQANEMLASIASHDGFYEQLATEELGRKITLPPAPLEPTQAEVDAAIDTPGLMRALYALRIGLRSEGLREWNWNLIGKSDRQLQAAAQLACDQHVWDRCINSSERAKGLYNVSQRFPMPYRNMVLPRATEVGLDPAYVLGLIRQESRFVADIKSSVGASGLMQLMPKTATWTAREIGMKDYNASKVTDPKTNIALGTAYLKLSVDEFGGSEALAAAGYNAGPGRPRRWRDGPELDGAVWAENVPFNETRAYVKTVLSAAVVYDMLLTGKSQSLRKRLGNIGPTNPIGQGSSRVDLP